MYSASKYLAASFLGLCSLTASAAPLLRVCADPNDLPYSDQQQKGFENQLATMIASDLGMQVIYTWFPQRGSFFRKTLDAGKCDVVMGVPAGMKGIDTTQPYYRSGYVFVSRRDRNLNIASFDDPRLHQLRIGIHNLGDTDREAPPVHALTSRGIVTNLVGYNIFGSNLDETDPSSDLIKAVEKGDIDLALVWGPIAGYFARFSPVPLIVSPIEGDSSNPNLPLSFDIAAGVRKEDDMLKQQLDSEFQRRRTEIQHLLVSYGIPQLSLSQARATGY
ncbi:MAG: quinoprotein dehydrogenase-associated putative ABC transporter substrate-binding protein [Candidatus Sulfotelmatobacter sp.]